MKPSKALLFVIVLLLFSTPAIAGCAQILQAVGFPKPEDKPPTMTILIKLSAGEISDPIFLTDYRVATIEAPPGTNWQVVDPRFVTVNPTNDSVSRDDSGGGAFKIQVIECAKNRCPARISVFVQK